MNLMSSRTRGTPKSKDHHSEVPHGKTRRRQMIRRDSDGIPMDAELYNLTEGLQAGDDGGGALNRAFTTDPDTENESLIGLSATEGESDTGTRYPGRKRRPPDRHGYSRQTSKWNACYQNSFELVTNILL